jgi:hypothetical protein
MSPDKFTFFRVINTCAGLGALKDSRYAHQLIIESGFESDVFVGCSLIDIYSRCGSINNAWRVFNKIPPDNVVTWNAMILRLVK